MELDIVEFKDPELNKLAETKYYEFLDWLNAQRRKAQAEVIALYPRLADGVKVQEIERVTDEAVFWTNIPDELAGAFAYQAVSNPQEHQRHQILAQALEITVFEFWLDTHYMPDDEVDDD